MNRKILVAGGTGDLGFRILKALRQRNADVVALIRPSADAQKVEEIKNLGIQMIEADMQNVQQLTQACEGVSCVVSALAGLRDVIVDAQSKLLDAAVSAGVPRFIPSDFSSDFTQLPEGENRNFDLRKDFHKKLDKAPIAATSIMNGAFADILAYNTPFCKRSEKSVAYWGDSEAYKVDFTTKDDTAAFTAAAAMDSSTPSVLRIASFQISPAELAAKATRLKGEAFKLIPMGSLASLSAHNKEARAANPQGEHELYPNWQGSQYMHSMFSTQNNPLDNERYPELKWTAADEVLAAI